MKLVLATPLYPPEIGGPATDSATLATHLLAAGIPAVVCPFSTVKRAPKLVRHIRYGYRLLQEARGASGIVSFDLVSVGLPAALVARYLGIPLIVRVPGDYAWEQGRQRFGVVDSIDAFQHKRYGPAVEALRAVQRFVVKSAALVVAPSDYFKGIVLGWGVSPERLVRIYLGLDRSDEPRMPSARPEGKTLFSVGRFVPWKGFPLILELLQALPEWRAVIAGEGPERARLEADAKRLGVAERVRFTGPLPHAEVLGWCAAADAYVLNTSFESFSFQVLEAMLMGAAIVTTAVGSLPELITDGVEGVLCTPDDLAAFRRALVSIEKEPGTWAARREAARLKAARFSLQASGEAFVRALKDVCA